MNDDRVRLWHRISAHRARLLRLARSRGLAVEDAEDCVHEAMLRCIEYEHLDEERIDALLTTVTVRLCVDRHRSRQSAERLRHRLATRPDADPGIEEDVCDRAEATWLAAHVSRLTPRQQEIVRARAAGLSCAEVAVSLRMSYSAVESQIARARAALRSARVSALGVLYGPWRQWEVAGAAGVSISVAVLVGAPAVPSPEPPQRPVLSRVASTVTTAPSPRRAVPPPTAVRVRPAPVPSPTAGPKSFVHVDRPPNGVVGRVGECLTHGIEFSRERIGCSSPPETPAR